MNYYGPRPKLRDGADPDDYDEDDIAGYHYTRRRDSRVTPLGYCAGGLTTTREGWDEKMGPNSPSHQYEDGWESPRAGDDRSALEANRRRMELFGEKFHDHLHDTESEAIACYTEYVLDQKLAFYDTEREDWRERLGVSPHGLSEPVTGDDIPPTVAAETCKHPGCETKLAYPTACISAGGGPVTDYYICEDHMDRESVAQWYTAPSQMVSSF